MILTAAKVGLFRSISTPQEVDIDSRVTVLVGMNEAGKTVFLKALSKANDAVENEKFNPTDDYPRKDYTSYMKRHDSEPDVAVALTYQLMSDEVDELNVQFGTQIRDGFSFTVSHKYDNTKVISMQVDEGPVINAFVALPGLSSDAVTAIKGTTSIRKTIDCLNSIDRNAADSTFLAELKARAEKTKWSNVIQHEVWQHISKDIPRFLYFSDYDLLPGKLNLVDLANRVAEAKRQPDKIHTYIQPKHKAVLALLRMADVDAADFSGGTTSYEELKAKIEAVSISLTDQVLEFWKQNEDLEVEVDIRLDSTDEPPFNNGANLYLRIKNRRHRGVTTSFDQRSRGFIWFFSFLVWFDSVQQQLELSKATKHSSSLVLLLDEPGLALHALAQADFLHYIDSLAEQHQVIYTTHSPFMVNSDRLDQVRIVEDRKIEGTVISKNLSGSDSRTIFPLQAALGWTLAQNLFIGKRNLLVEGPSELAYLKSVSALIEASGGEGLSENITIIPSGGLSNVATFVLLLGGNGLEFVVLHDYGGGPDQKLDSLIRDKLLMKKRVFNASQFRDESKFGENGKPSDIEDLFEPSTYLDYFNKAYDNKLRNSPLLEAELNTSARHRIVQQIEDVLKTRGIKLRPSGGFNHYTIASEFAISPPTSLDEKTVKRFAALFKAINSAFK